MSRRLDMGGFSVAGLTPRSSQVRTALTIVGTLGASDLADLIYSKKHCCCCIGGCSRNQCLNMQWQTLAAMQALLDVASISISETAQPPPAPQQKQPLAAIENQAPAPVPVQQKPLFAKIKVRHLPSRLRRPCPCLI